MVENGDEVGDLAGVDLGALTHGWRPVVHDGEAGAGEGVAEVDNVRVVGAGGVGAEEYHESGPAFSVGDDVDIAGTGGAVGAGELGEDMLRFAGEPGLRLDGDGSTWAAKAAVWMAVVAGRKSARTATMTTAITRVIM